MVGDVFRREAGVATDEFSDVLVAAMEPLGIRVDLDMLQVESTTTSERLSAEPRSASAFGMSSAAIVIRSSTASGVDR